MSNENDISISEDEEYYVNPNLPIHRSTARGGKGVLITKSIGTHLIICGWV